MTNSPDIEFKSKILEKIGIDDEFDVVLTIFVLTFLWPIVACIGVFMGFFVGVIFLFGTLTNWIISAIQYIIKLFVKSKNNSRP